MKALFTAEVSEEARELEALLDIQYEGWVKDQEILSEADMIRLMPGKDILITSYDPITRGVMDASGQLKLIVVTRANPVNVDIDYAHSKGIKVSYAPERNSACTAEFTIAMMLSAMRRIPFAHAALKRGEHTATETVEQRIPEGLRLDVTWALGKNTPYLYYKGYQMQGRVLGIIGYGSIGRRVARLARAFGMRIVAYDPFLPPDRLEEGVELTDFDTLLRTADVVTVHCKDAPETRGIMDAAAFSKMKPDAFFINSSRGALVDEKALIDVLLHHKIAGAALDVYDSEPIAADHPFITQCDNVVLTPHLAGATYDAIDFHTKQLVTDVRHFLNGEPLEFEYK